MSTFSIYDIKINSLYEQLLKKHYEEIKNNLKYKSVVKIEDDHIFFDNGQKIEYEHIISTIPLETLYSLTGDHSDLEYQQCWYYHLQAEFDFEGANQVLVVDRDIDFFKVTNIARNRYLFYFTEDLQLPGSYFMNFSRNFEILDGTTIEKAFPLGNRENLKPLKNKRIDCVGAQAEHDWCADVGSNIMRMLRSFS